MAMGVMWCLLILSVLHDRNCVVDGGGERAPTDGRLHSTSSTVVALNSRHLRAEG